MLEANLSVSHGSGKPIDIGYKEPKSRDTSCRSSRGSNVERKMRHEEDEATAMLREREKNILRLLSNSRARGFGRKALRND